MYTSYRQGCEKEALTNSAGMFKHPSVTLTPHHTIIFVCKFELCVMSRVLVKTPASRVFPRSHIPIYGGHNRRPSDTMSREVYNCYTYCICFLKLTPTLHESILYLVASACSFFFCTFIYKEKLYYHCWNNLIFVITCNVLVLQFRGETNTKICKNTRKSSSWTINTIFNHKCLVSLKTKIS